MLSSYFKVAIRNIMKTKLYSFLNILGLSIGLAGLILIILYTYYQMTYDTYHQNADRIYRIASKFSVDGKEDLFAASSFAIAPLFKEDYPEVEDFVRFSNMGDLVLKYNNALYKVSGNYFCEQSVFKMFTHEIIAGSEKDALTGLNKVVISESTAEKIFADEDPIGKNLTNPQGQVYTVTAVFKDLPGNVHLRYNALYSAENLNQRLIALQGPGARDYHNPQFLWQINDMSYILLKSNTNHDAFIKKAIGFGDKYMNEQGKQFNTFFEPLIQPLRDTHYGKLQWDSPAGKKEYIALFIMVGFFLLLIACINYMNLSTARSAKRAKEVGLRKVVGAQRNQLITQFLTESVLIALIALFFALIIAELVLPLFNQMAGTQLSLKSHIPWWLYPSFLILTVLVGMISGSYPAFFLSAYQPAIVIKGELTKGVKGKLIREILVVFQFSLSIIMIISTLVVLKQLNYLRSQPLGYQKENVINIEAARDSVYAQNYVAFRNEILKESTVKGVATSNSAPVGEQGKLIFAYEKNGKTVTVGFNYMVVDPSFLKLMGIPLAQGRNFESVDGVHYSGKMIETIPTEFVINEAAAKSAGWSNPINQKFSNAGDPNLGKVIGVVKDFNYNSLHNTVEPLALLPSNRVERSISIRISAENTPQTLAKLEVIWGKYFPNTPFDYQFIEEKIDQLYASELKLSKIFTYFSIMCILIACQGLLGLATFASQQRTKEIGIRKVMGSNIRSIIILLTKDFSKLVIISNVIALPLAFFLMNYWLKKFPYHIGIPVSSFIIAMTSGFVIAWLTVGVVAYKAASANPVEALHYE
ncbi:MAG TPA: ABC transporter permease [Candidatus Cloacimonadota bacterium]|nr:ABC transporter permease [Candidatus Cloacimonadota bacterium]